ncbi:MAG: response regulator transcription factor [Acidimicrobiales bacterium]
MSSSELILVVEDEPTIADAIASRLRSEGYQVSVAVDGPGAVEQCTSLAPDLVVLDLNLPGFDGIEVCRRIHTYRRVPVVMLTARDDETDMLVGLGVGADDYMTKPFSPRELVARIKAVLRRAQSAGNGGPTLSFETPAGPIAIDPTTRRVTEEGREIHLTPTEFDLLRALAEAGGAVLSRDQLLAMVWGYRDGSGARTVDSHIRSVRAKLTADLIRTVHGVGYALENVPAKGLSEP